MKPRLTFIVALLFLFTTDVTAQSRRSIPAIPAHAIPPGMSAVQFQKKLQQMTNIAHGMAGGVTGYAQKTTAGTERMFAEATVNPGTYPRADDSMVFIYSPGRSSAFDFENLGYAFEEANNDFYPAQFGDYGYVDYDSLNYYGLSGTSSYQTPGIRSYNAVGKVTKAVQADHLILFAYNASGKLTTSTKQRYDATTSTYVGEDRNFYFYNTVGHLIKDSTERWYNSSWMPDGTFYHTLNAAGYPTKTELVDYTGPVRHVIFEATFAYNGMNQEISSLRKSFRVTGLQPYYSDTTSYAGAMIMYNDWYRWDTATSSLALSGQERRRMNASGLPDSVWVRDDYYMDTTIFTLAYNAQGNPVKKWVFFSNGGTADLEHRWYYEPVSQVGVAQVPVKADLLAYPNPAGEMLYLQGATEGSYAIRNPAGQMLQSGTLRSSSGVPTGMLVPGIYFISLLDKAGALHSARFVRQ